MSLAFQGGSILMESKPVSLKLMMTLALVTMGQRAFMNRTVGEILWGYDDPFVHFLNTYLPDMLPIKGKFGLFVGVSVFCPFRESGYLSRTLTQTSLNKNWEIISSYNRRCQDYIQVRLDPVRVGGYGWGLT
jgi:hypothetical protein